MAEPGSAPRLVLVAHCAEMLRQLVAGTTGVLHATVSTADGLAVASTLPDPHAVDKLAAMSASISALAFALAQETRQGEPVRLLLESSQGHTVSLKVPVPQGNLVLTVITDNSAVLGKLLWDCKACAEKIAAGAAELAT